MCSSSCACVLIRPDRRVRVVTRKPVVGPEPSIGGAIVTGDVLASRVEPYLFEAGGLLELGCR